MERARRAMPEWSSLAIYLSIFPVSGRPSMSTM
jgi:hypothetical protein